MDQQRARNGLANGLHSSAARWRTLGFSTIAMDHPASFSHSASSSIGLRTTFNFCLVHVTTRGIEEQGFTPTIMTWLAETPSHDPARTPLLPGHPSLRLQIPRTARGVPLCADRAQSSTNLTTLWPTQTLHHAPPKHMFPDSGVCVTASYWHWLS